MDIRIIDRNRNVTVIGDARRLSNGMPPSALLAELYEHHAATIHTGRVDFECDRDFLQALTDEAISDPETVFGAGDECEGPSFRGVPIIVTGEEQPS